jgi:hypothetical protein
MQMVDVHRIGFAQVRSHVFHHYWQHLRNMHHERSYYGRALHCTVSTLSACVRVPCTVLSGSVLCAMVCGYTRPAVCACAVLGCVQCFHLMRCCVQIAVVHMLLPYPC